MGGKRQRGLQAVEAEGQEAEENAGGDGRGGVGGLHSIGGLPLVITCWGVVVQKGATPRTVSSRGKARSRRTLQLCRSPGLWETFLAVPSEGSATGQ